MGKILIIGQAPPAVKQIVPYDTTLLYEILYWVNISKEQAQEIFEFEAMVNTFPGRTENGHKAPDKHSMHRHYKYFLIPKIQQASKVILLGNVAKENCTEFGIYAIKGAGNILCLPHPSRRNYSLIMKNKDSITNKLKQFLQ